MPIVPDPTTQSVMPSGHPSPYLTSNATPDAFGAQVGQGLQRVGAAIGQAADVASNAAIRFQQIQNETDVNDKYAQFSSGVRQTLFDPKNGYYTKQGKDAVDAMAPTTQAIESLRTDTRANLANPAQQMMFDQVSRRRVEMELDSMSSHAAQQNNVYRAQASDALVKDFINDGADYYNDDKRFQVAVNSGNTEIQAYGQQAGQADAVIQARQRQFLNTIYTARFERMKVADPEGAANFYQQNTDKFDGTEHARIEQDIQSSVMPGRVKSAVDGIIGGQRPAANLQQLTQAIIGKESGFNANAVSPKGARGLMQIMPATAQQVAAELHIPYDPKRLTSDPEYNQVLGTRYLQDLFAKFGGNQTLAVAAYNAGPGVVSDWINGTNNSGKNPSLNRLGDPTKGEISDADFAAKIPFAETRKYVQGLNAQFPLQPGTVATSDDPRLHLQDWLNQADAAADQMYPGNAVAKRMIEAEVRSRVSTIVETQSAQKQQDRYSLYSAVAGLNGGKPTSLGQMLKNPALMDAWTRSDPQTKLGVMQTLEQNSQPDLDKAMPLIYRLQGEATNSPAAFANEDLSKYFGQIPNQQMQQLMNLQMRVSKQDAAQETKAMNINHAKSIARPLLQAAGINPNPKTPEDAQTMNQFTGRLMQSMDQFQFTNKRLPNDKEIMEMSRSLLAPGIVDKGSWFGNLFNNDTVPAFKVDDMSKFRVPDTERTKIINDYRVARGVLPNEDIIKQIYMRAYAKGVH